MKLRERFAISQETVNFILAMAVLMNGFALALAIR